jgi:hypothetical protein
MFATMNTQRLPKYDAGRPNLSDMVNSLSST